ncbi:MAG: hypothetical protein GYA62_11275, partial [Bacteroidales bacterium]|nr:hypothetical protein [Bacteroidales bacterium]
MCIFRFKGKITEPSPEYAKWLSQQKTFESVHSYINDFTYVDDKVQFGVLDYWQTPSQYFATNTGDCEDVHLFLADAIYRALGWESYLLIGWKWEKFPRAIAHG